MVAHLLALLLLVADVSCDPAALIDRNRSALVVIDVQQPFLTKLPLDARSALIDRISNIMWWAIYFDMPLIVTAEDIKHTGPIEPKLQKILDDKLPGHTVFSKMVWNLYGQADIRAAVDATGRDSFILVGLETDVCVAQSALGLQEAGYKVAVIEDATMTPPPHHEAGLRRLRDARVTVTTTKSLYYELVRDIPTAHRVDVALNGTYPTLGCASDYTV